MDHFKNDLVGSIHETWRHVKKNNIFYTNYSVTFYTYQIITFLSY